MNKKEKQYDTKTLLHRTFNSIDFRLIELFEVDHCKYSLAGRAGWPIPGKSEMYIAVIGRTVKDE